MLRLRDGLGVKAPRPTENGHFSLAHVPAAVSPFLQETPLSGIELDLAARVPLRNDGTEYCV